MQPAAHSDRPATALDTARDASVGASVHTAADGDAAADVTAQLEALRERPLHEHVAVYQDLHVRLQAALAEIDSA